MNKGFDNSKFKRLTANELAKAYQAPQRDDDWTPISPVPDEVQKVALRLKLFKDPGARFKIEGGWKDPDQSWPYFDEDKKLIGFALRWNNAGGKKEFRFASYGEDTKGQLRWAIRHLPSPRPLYGLDRLAARPDAPWLSLPKARRLRTRLQRSF